MLGRAELVACAMSVLAKIVRPLSGNVANGTVPAAPSIWMRLQRMSGTAYPHLLRPCPPLPGHVLKVFLVRAYEEMTGTRTGGIVTVMADLQALRDWAVGQLPRHAMGVMTRPSIGIVESSITRTEITAPAPAAISHYYPCPVALDQRLQPTPINALSHRPQYTPKQGPVQ